MILAPPGVKYFMRKSVFYFLALLVWLRPFHLSAQPNTSLAVVFKDEKIRLLDHVNYISDTGTMDGLFRVIESKVDSIQQLILSYKALPALEKEKATRSVVYFMQELSEKISERKLEMYDIPGALQTYKSILKALLYHKPFADILKPLGAGRCQLMVGAFSQYHEYALLDDIAVYKRVASAPEFILRFLEEKPGFRFADSLLLVAAAYDPMKIVSYLNQDKPGLQQNIRHSKNQYLQQIVSLSGDRNASQLLPFVIQIAENGITPGEIIEKRQDVTKYFQLLVNTRIQSAASGNPSPVFGKVLRDGIKQKALSFYVNPINEQHSATDATRFAPVKDLRPEDLYYIITSCGDELYTSSYLGLYKRLMKEFKAGCADSLFQIVQYDNFSTFIRLAANYNVLADFLSKMPDEKAAELLKSFISGIENDTDTGLEKAMDIADCFTALDSSKQLVKLIQQELESNLSRCQSGDQYFGMRLYSILLQVFDQVKQKGALTDLWSRLGNYEVLQRSSLQNTNGEIIELTLFYGDPDGVASFNSFQKLFTDTNKWKVSKNESWITIRSVSDEPVIIYANLPLDNKKEMDLKAQDALLSFLAQQSIEPAVLIHRGHSYHLSNTLQKLKPSVKLAILGSCGGYNSAISIASINPDAQIIGSKKSGSKSINDPIIEVINATLLNKKDLSWPLIWEKLQDRFRKDEFTLNLFNEYIPPGKNVSLFVLKLFNYYNRPVEVVVN